MSTTTITEELIALVEAQMDAFTTGDNSAWAGRISQQHVPVGIGTDPQEFWVGVDTLVGVTNAQLGEMSGLGFRFEIGDLIVQAVGDVTWAVGQPTLRLPDGTGVPMRVTIIASREGGELRWNHFHLSIGASNEEALDADLTITVD